jgi:hypothetical protein
MGAFTGASLLALLGAWLAPKLTSGFEGAAALTGGWLGAGIGAALGFGLALWLTFRDNAKWGGRVVTALTSTAIMMCVCFAYVAFS